MSNVINGGPLRSSVPRYEPRPVTYLRAQVVYKQGLVKDFIVPGAWTLDEFMRQTQLFGKVRLLRSLRAVQDVSVEVAAGNVTVLPHAGGTHASR